MRRRLEDEYGTDPRLRFLGWLPYDQYLAHLRSCKVFMHLPRVEPWGASIGEAIAAGAYVVASEECIAAVELLTEPSLGVVVNNPSEALDAAVEYLRRDSSPPQSIRTEAVRTIAPNTWVDSLSELYTTRDLG